MGVSYAAVHLGALFLTVILSASRPARAQAVTDPFEILVLKNISQKYSIDSWTFDDDPCGPKGQSIFVGYMKCVCTYNNGATCHIVQLYMYAKSLHGTFPMDVFNLKYLTFLDFGQNYLHGSLPRELGNLTGLTHFAAGTNLLTGTIPLELGNLRNLTDLYLDSNYLSGEIPMELANLSRLSTFWLLDNNLTGPLPDIFGSMTSLKDMRIYGNNLEGPIPASIKNLTKLENLYIGELQGGGVFPAGLSNLQNLTVLSLRNNGLTGSIPLEIGSMLTLTTVDLSFNALTGSIPSSLVNLPVLKSLYLGGNKLTGSIPTSLLQSRSLKYLDLSFNQLEGSLPSWNPTESDIDLNPIWNSLNGSFQPSGMNSSALALLDCASNAHCARQTGENSNFAINVGGVAYPASSVMYDADNQTTSVYTAPSNVWLESTSGRTYLLTAVGQISGASDSFLYMSARQALSSLRYLGLGMSNGAYTVEIQFSEIGFYDSSVGRRLFDVHIQGTVVLRDFNIQKTANGSYKAFALKFPATVANNVLDIHFFWAGKGTCCIPKGYEDYGPLVSAIRVYADSSPAEVVDGHSSKKAAIIASACSGAVILLVICFLLFFVRKWRKIRLRKEASDGQEFVSFEGAPMVFSYEDIRIATNDFHPDNKLGQGGFGSVHKGLLRDGSCVAIKVLSAGSLQGREEFMNEVNLITGVQHRNLVKLKGCCLEGGQPMLVYEYLENRSLDKILFEPQDTIFLDWPTRFNIIIGIARGLSYLHEESHTPIIHRDIKASNILLDGKLMPKIADFGLARLFVEDTSHVTTRIAGTRGYMAPEYAFRGKLTVKADVYSFGVLVLEILSGRKNTDTKASEEQEFLVEWAWNLREQGHLLDLTDPRLKNEYGHVETSRVIHVALWCVLPAAQMRPTMSRATSMLLGDVEVPPLPPKPDYFGDSKKVRNIRSSASTEMSTSTSTTTQSFFSSGASQSSTYSDVLTPR